MSLTIDTAGPDQGKCEASGSVAATIGTRPLDEVMLQGLSFDRLYRLSVDQFHRMVESGILTEVDKVELIEGLLVEKMSRFARHINTTRLFVRAFGRAVPDGWFVAKEDPAVMPRSVPEPDVAVLRGREEDYFNRRAGGGDIALVVEIAESSYSDDLRKRAIYADAAIPIYWIVNLNADRIEVYTEPSGPDAAPQYRSRHDYSAGDQVPLLIDGREVAQLAVAALLAPRPEAAE